MTLRDFDSFDDKELKLGIARGLDLTVEKAAELAEVSMSTANRWILDDKIKRLISITRTVCAQRTEKVTAEVANDARTRMSKIFDSALTKTEQLLRKMDEKGDNATVEELMEVHKYITMSAAKYQLSEAPKRIKIDEEHRHLHAHVVRFADVESMIRTRQMIAGAQQLLPATEPSDGNPG